jgi:hypothetical protein
VDEVIKDLEVDVDCLLALDPILTCPADGAPDRAQEALSITWAPHQAICERVAKRFPLAKESTVQRLGRTTWDSYMRCKASREENAQRVHRGDDRDPVDLQLVLPAKTVAASSRSKDSGLGSSLPTSYAETVMSYRRNDGDSVKVPPLPKLAREGVPFDCMLCGDKVVATTNSAWK